MEYNKVIRFLEKYDYTYTVKDKIITTNLNLSQNVIIDLSNSQKVIISDELVNWNFLTGGIIMSLKKAIIYNFVAMVFFVFFCQYLEFSNKDFSSLLLVFIGWVLIFTSYYSINLASFKQGIIHCTSE
ncbi:hypothetical protein OIU80_12240 [Flavobacterium sp. LS1R47]|uniref:Uncharacterized protein n=1 Tax=Flavobacterium frigoritolerans TaxID=2987686 RepID=A0A9X2ZRZ2_9FLAO|nr:hypothetical protein [Flavobacterium frigoritolerans]MCV9933053.1 hypothetical protein [Flavobacterium frigoritolerans]